MGPTTRTYIRYPWDHMTPLIYFEWPDRTTQGKFGWEPFPRPIPQGTLFVRQSSPVIGPKVVENPYSRKLGPTIRNLVPANKISSSHKTESYKKYPWDHRTQYTFCMRHTHEYIPLSFLRVAFFFFVLHALSQPSFTCVFFHRTNSMFGQEYLWLSLWVLIVMMTALVLHLCEQHQRTNNNKYAALPLDENNNKSNAVVSV